MYIATVENNKYTFQGFGRNPKEAKDCMVNEVNDFLGENLTLGAIYKSPFFQKVEVFKVRYGYGNTLAR